MIKIVMCLRDVKAELFMQPFFVPAVGVGYRNLIDEVDRGGADNILAKHAQDFDIYQLATFDDESGEFLAVVPSFLCSVASLLPIKS